MAILADDDQARPLADAQLPYSEPVLFMALGQGRTKNAPRSIVEFAAAESCRWQFDSASWVLRDAEADRIRCTLGNPVGAIGAPCVARFDRDIAHLGATGDRKPVEFLLAFRFRPLLMRSGIAASFLKEG